MGKLMGLYIDDEPKNVTVMQGRFSLYEDIEVIGLNEFPENLDNYYDVIVKNNVSFLIIDRELVKKPVSYNGTDILRAIRKHDSTIYAILLTNSSPKDYQDELGEYDSQFRKIDLADNYIFNCIISRIKRACSSG